MFNDYEMLDHLRTHTAELRDEMNHIRQARAARPEGSEPTYRQRHHIWASLSARLRHAHA